MGVEFAFSEAMDTGLLTPDEGTINDGKTEGGGTETRRLAAAGDAKI